jgi:FkbH-like protein
VLDLDNTLWGGVIGDDGLSGINVAQGDARGEAFRAVQSCALALKRRGIVLAVCSKNDDATARLPFQSHPSMILKEEDIAVFVANWEDKATNLRRIARQLDIGVDALVLLDDNPAERALVRQLLPEVAVPEVGADPSTYVRALTCSGYFETISFTAEDLGRAEQYRANADRAALAEASGDLDSYLRSLAMEIEFKPFDEGGRKRVTQLINKTNQFNLTTRRYTEAQVTAMEQDAAYHTLQVSLRDRFGDNGMISVTICRAGPDAWEIDTWLMSCRVINRRVEDAVLNQIALAARAAGARHLVGEYIPTDRNGLVADLLARLGFVQAMGGAFAGRWVLDLDRFTELQVPIRLAADALPA